MLQRDNDVMAPPTSAMTDGSSDARTAALQSPGEELANSLSHGLGLGLSAAALPVLLLHAQGAAATVGAALFGATALLLYLSSTLYHAISRPSAKAVLRWLDHASIYLFIAGTYTPFTLTVLRGAWGWTLFGLVWGMAALGLLFKALGPARFPRLSTLLYLAMGWIVLIAIVPLWHALPASGLAWLFAGGAAYTLGVIFFSIDERVPYAHFVWHLFVLTGTVCHFIAILQCAGGHA